MVLLDALANAVVFRGVVSMTQPSPELREQIAAIVDPKPWSYVQRGIQVIPQVLAESLSKADAILKLIEQETRT